MQAIHFWVARLSRLAPAIGLSFCAAGRAGAEEDTAGFWGNTLSTTAELPGTMTWHPGSMLLALLVVVALIVALAWLLRRAGWTPKPQATAGSGEKILCYARFNARQTLMLVEAEQDVRLVVLRGRQVEFMADLPAWVRSGHPPQGQGGGLRPAGRRKTFQELWLQYLQAVKRPRA